MRAAPADDPTLVALLRRRAAEEPDRLAYRFLADGDEREECLTYAELDARARAVAVRLREAGAAGERVLVLCPPGLDYLGAFFGCLYAGAAAVPAYPPSRTRATPRLRSMVDDARPAVVLATAELADAREALAALAPELGPLPWVRADGVEGHEAHSWREPAPRPDSLAFVQYTSGSTSAPRGVMLSHANLLHNLSLIQALFQTARHTHGVVWLPPYHDMGLIGGILQPLYGGFPVTLMSPVAFLQKPLRWLRAISRFGGTMSGGPDFAYALCTRRVSDEERSTLDLSRWELAFDGAEPIRAATLAAFAEAFAPCGFRREAFYPCYGLAEATLIVSGGTKGAGAVVRPVDAEALREHRVADPPAEGDPRWVVGCGRAAPDTEIRIVDTATLLPAAPGRTGEVWVAGPSVARGYWGRPAESAETFVAAGEKVFLRTGDLGFLGDDGELFVTGRLKEVMVVRGRNHYPQDVEWTAAASHPALQPGGGAAFGVEAEGEERVALVHEVGRHHLGAEVEEVAEAIRRAVLEEHGVAVHAVALVRPGTVPKTSSGKVQRRACRAAYLAGEIPLLAVSTLGAPAPEAADEGEPPPLPAGPVAARVRALAAEALGVDPRRLDPARPLVSLGLDSLRAAELAHALEVELGVPVPPVLLLGELGADALAARLLEGGGEAREEDAGEAEDARASFAQERLWVLDRLHPGTPAYNVPAALRLAGALDRRALRRALDEVVARHDALRTTFRPGSGGAPVRTVHPPGGAAWAEVDLRGLGAAESAAACERALRDEARRPFDLAAGPLLRATLVRVADDEQVLLLVLHHIVCDGGSMGVLARELGALYGAFARGEPSPLAPLRAGYGGFVRWERRQPMEAGTEYWRTRLAGAPPAAIIPTDLPRPAARSYLAGVHEAQLPAEVCGRLRALARDEGATPFMALLAVMQATLAGWTGERRVVVGTDASLREVAGAAGGVGLFVNQLVLTGELADDLSFRALVRGARDTALGAYEHARVPFQQVVAAANPPREPGRNPLFQVMLVMEEGAAPRLDGLETGVLELPPPGAPFDISVLVTDTPAGYRVLWRYAAELFEPATIATLAEGLARVAGRAAADGDATLAALAAEARAPLRERAGDEARRLREEGAARFAERRRGRGPASPDTPGERP